MKYFGSLVTPEVIRTLDAVWMQFYGRVASLNLFSDSLAAFITPQ
jgi:hypothetical protein